MPPSNLSGAPSVTSPMSSTGSSPSMTMSVSKSTATDEVEECEDEQEPIDEQPGDDETCEAEPAGEEPSNEEPGDDDETCESEEPADEEPQDDECEEDESVPGVSSTSSASPTRYPNAAVTPQSSMIAIQPFMNEEPVEKISSAAPHTSYATYSPKTRHAVVALSSTMSSVAPSAASPMKLRLSTTFVPVPTSSSTTSTVNSPIPPSSAVVTIIDNSPASSPVSQSNTSTSETGTGTFTPQGALTDPSQTSSGHSTSYIVGVSFAVIISLILIVFGITCFRRKLTRRQPRNTENISWPQTMEDPFSDAHRSFSAGERPSQYTNPIGTSNVSAERPTFSPIRSVQSSKFPTPSTRYQSEKRNSSQPILVNLSREAQPERDYQWSPVGVAITADEARRRFSARSSLYPATPHTNPNFQSLSGGLGKGLSSISEQQTPSPHAPLAHNTNLLLNF